MRRSRKGMSSQMSSALSPVYFLRSYINSNASSTSLMMCRRRSMIGAGEYEGEDKYWCREYMGEGRREKENGL